MNVRMRWLLLLFLWVFPGIPCWSAPQAAAHVFSFRLIGEPETLDWNKAHTPVENYLMINLMEGLVLLDENLKVQPALAESWKLGKDGKTYVFKLRPGVKWSDGVPLKAQDFVYSWKRLLSPDTAASYAYFLYDIEGAEAFSKGTLKDFSRVGVKALDDRTLQVKLAEPVAYWLDIPTFWVTYPLRQDIVEKYGNAWTQPGKMVTVGPYVLASHEAESRVVLKPNPRYYGKRGNIDEIDALVVKDDSTALTLFESGKLDFMSDIPSIDLTRLEGKPELKTFPYLKTGYLGFTVEKAEVADSRVRHAISMAIDKSKFAELLHGGQFPATSFVPPKVLAYSKSVGLPFDPARARKELAAAGYGPSKPLALQILIPNWDRPTTLAEYIQSELKKNLGIEATIQPFDHKTFRSQVALHSYPLYILSWGADYPDPDNFMSMWLSDSGNNWSGWKNRKYDELVVKARRIRGSRAREKLYSQAQKLLLDQDSAILPLYYDTNPVLVASRVKGFVLSPNNYVYFKKVNLGP